MENKFKEVEELSKIVDNLKKTGKRVGLSHGVFDLVHPGHIQHFIAAKKEVDYLIVSITADSFVNKGPGRPIFEELIRISTLSALSVVDFVTISREKTAEKIISYLKPDLYFKGSDYVNQANDPTGKIEDERLVVELNGGRVFFTDEMTSSSSKLINAYLNTSSLEIRNWLNEIKSKYSVMQIEMYLNKLSNLKVAIIGEIILDEYTKVCILGLTSYCCIDNWYR
jgi:rfaE bifunctional protein nucleotidyltransferase chain/domain